ncbi:hypothetical protein Bca101_091903 [Brassica carinata]
MSGLRTETRRVVTNTRGNGGEAEGERRGRGGRRKGRVNTVVLKPLCERRLQIMILDGTRFRSGASKSDRGSLARETADGERIENSIDEDRHLERLNASGDNLWRLKQGVRDINGREETGLSMDRSGFNELQSESLKEGRQWRSRQVTSGRTSSATEASSTDLSLGAEEATPTASHTIDVGDWTRCGCLDYCAWECLARAKFGSGPASPGRVCPESEGPVPAFGDMEEQFASGWRRIRKHDNCPPRL